MYEAQFVREVLERACVAAGPRPPSAAVLAALDKAVREQGASIRGRDYATFYQWDETFHDLLCSLSGHEGISDITNLARAHLNRLRQLSLKDNVQLMRELHGEHRAIVEALRRNDPTAADQALREHLRRIFRYVDELRQRHPGFFVDQSVEARPLGDAVVLGAG